MFMAIQVPIANFSILVNKSKILYILKAITRFCEEKINGQTK